MDTIIIDWVEKTFQSLREKPKMQLPAVYIQMATPYNDEGQTLEMVLPVYHSHEQLVKNAKQFEEYVLTAALPAHQKGIVFHTFMFDRKGTSVATKETYVQREKGKVAEAVVHAVWEAQWEYKDKHDTLREALFYAVANAGDDPNQVVIVYDYPEKLDKPGSGDKVYVDVVAYSPTRIYVIDYEPGWGNDCPYVDVENLFTWFPRNPEEPTVPLVAPNET